LFGTLAVNKFTPAYSYVANDSAIEALTALASESFIVTVSDGVLIDRKTLSVNISQSGITESNANDSLTGTAGNDKFNSLGGNDIINGLAGADIMDGGSGNDVYYVDNIGDVVIENSSIATEIDRVISSISYTLSNNTENLVLSGKTAVNGTGNALKNSLLGNAAANILDGMAGNDILTGGNGNDILIGGLGKDKLVGGNDADIFKFNAILESVNNTNRDTITDFLTIQGDKIDLSMIDADSSTAIDNAFSVLNVGAFNGSFVNTANLFFDSSSHILYGNNDSDEAADFSILLTGVSTLTISDILA
jgi:Ca2+-binding RTX toxin-like protein